MVETSTSESFYGNNLNEKNENEFFTEPGESFEPSDPSIQAIFSYSKALEIKTINDRLTISHLLN